MAELFNVVFAGEIVGRADPAVVRANVGKLFGASDAVLDKLFSGQPVAIKKLVDRATAMQLRARMKQAGAETRLVQVDEQGRPLEAAAGVAVPPPATPAGAPAAAARPAMAAPAAAATSAPAAPTIPRPAPAPAPASAAATTAATAPTGAAAPGGSMAARLQALAQEQASAAAAAPAAAAAGGSWDVKPVGTRLSDPAPPPPPPPDTSALSVKAPGGTLVAPQELPRPAPVQVDISGLSMAAAGTEVLKEEERRQVVPVKVDLSGLSMAEVGAPLDELREHKAPLNPDTSYLKMAE